MQEHDEIVSKESLIKTFLRYKSAFDNLKTSMESELGKVVVTDYRKELRLIEAKIKDVEFDLNISQRRMDTFVMSDSKLSLMSEASDIIAKDKAMLLKLREQRNKLIEKL